jgi:hypothetical protein
MHGDLGLSLEIVFFGGLGIILLLLGLFIFVVSKNDKKISLITPIVFVSLGVVLLVFSSMIS